MTNMRAPTTQQAPCSKKTDAILSILACVSSDNDDQSTAAVRAKNRKRIISGMLDQWCTQRVGAMYESPLQTEPKQETATEFSEQVALEMVSLFASTISTGDVDQCSCVMDASHQHSGTPPAVHLDTDMRKELVSRPSVVSSEHSDCCDTVSSQSNARSSPMSRQRMPCRARGMSKDHNRKTAYFEVSEHTKHGDDLMCSHSICRQEGIKFRYCSKCDNPAARGNFRLRHSHAKVEEDVAVVIQPRLPAARAEMAQDTTTNAFTQSESAQVSLEITALEDNPTAQRDLPLLPVQIEVEGQDVLNNIDLVSIRDKTDRLLQTAKHGDPQAPSHQQLVMESLILQTVIATAELDQIARTFDIKTERDDCQETRGYDSASPDPLAYWSGSSTQRHGNDDAHLSAGENNGHPDERAVQYMCQPDPCEPRALATKSGESSSQPLPDCFRQTFGKRKLRNFVDNCSGSEMAVGDINHVESMDETRTIRLVGLLNEHTDESPESETPLTLSLDAWIQSVLAVSNEDAGFDASSYLTEGSFDFDAPTVAASCGEAEAQCQRSMFSNKRPRRFSGSSLS